MRSVLLALLLATGQWLSVVHAQDHERLSHTAEQCELCLLAHAHDAAAPGAEPRADQAASTTPAPLYAAPASQPHQAAAANLIRGPPQPSES